MTYEKDRWFSPVPPGWPATLAMGEFSGVPWFVNPVRAAYVSSRHISCCAKFVPVARLVSASFSGTLAMVPFHEHEFHDPHRFFVLALAAGLGLARARRTGKSAGHVWLARNRDGYAGPAAGRIIVAAIVGPWAIGVGGRRLRFPALVTLAVAALWRAHWRSR